MVQLLYVFQLEENRLLPASGFQWELRPNLSKAAACAQSHQARQDELAADRARLAEQAARLERELADAQRALAEESRRAREAALAADSAAMRANDRCCRLVIMSPTPNKTCADVVQGDLNKSNTTSDYVMTIPCQHLRRKPPCAYGWLQKQPALAHYCANAHVSAEGQAPADWRQDSLLLCMAELKFTLPCGLSAAPTDRRVIKLEEEASKHQEAASAAALRAANAEGKVEMLQKALQKAEERATTLEMQACAGQPASIIVLVP